MAGLTPEALLFCIFCMLWTAATAAVASIVAWVSMKSTTRLSFDFATLLSTVVTTAMLASIGQQIYTAANWDALKENERQDSIRQNQGEVFYDVGSDKVVMAFYYIQIICYNIGGTLVMFWSFWLWANVWPLRGHWWRSKTYLNIAKALCVVVCTTLFGVSQSVALRTNALGRFVVANICLITVLALTPVFVTMILYRFVQIRLQATGGIKVMNQFPNENKDKESVTSQGSYSFNHSKENHNPNAQRRDSRMKTLSPMLMLRFIGAIVVMSGLEVFHVCFQVYRIAKFAPGSSAIKEIPITTAQQIGDTYLFLPATSQGWLVFLVFGTTEGNWEKIKQILHNVFCCVGIRKRLAAKDAEAAVVSPRTVDWVELRSNSVPSVPNVSHDYPTRSHSYSSHPHREHFKSTYRAEVVAMPSRGHPKQGGLKTATYSWSEESLNRN